MATVTSIDMKQIEEKVMSGGRLSREDGIALYGINDILFLGALARYVKEKKSGNHAYFNVNRHINLTNVCVNQCKFCAFKAKEGEPHAYTMTLEEIMSRALEAPKLGATELHIVSGCHPDLPFDYYLEAISECKKALPDIHIQAFTAVEIDYFAKISGLTARGVLEKLKEAGLGSMPGGGAEIFSGRVRGLTCENKASGDRWLEVMGLAHELGLRSNATMLYGHVETYEERIDHMIKLREHQDKTGGFQSFIPLAFHPDNTDLAGIKRTTAFDDIKTIAISRLMLDNFDHVKAFWIMLGLKIAQLALDFGADDLDGTVVEEKITHMAGAQTDESIEKEELIRLIKDTGRTPVERDTLYNIIRVYE
ncbi:MAG: aminofutalosine synthase MqnE [Candidatus Aquicultor secundus]|uniref:Aminodeoxyfutalosine synthase n=1 Tax=Candidatus Aquicultor secundus TaxID=1973895 RepID=A0A2M7T606_9ACTN|nr:aminofutalosine synthase MqnE [Candidatus Aquicultor secundus]NCO65757.1 aminofutalosine synthase MqnE [Solirubrobacter sp.]OIO84882.1 MAG: aminofutalosine synthase MqnE [Candidatus Aquicultor secundus]PIU26493.1 MAG: aminofutalosine synthase MqnE [Candidatus Aquicultor secundus]PIW21536.1 MAG: aminofutalosine synthase MqnE [Candidatus Aquicultor secundus]PIX52633.1 MAG: aminofutalosine synthase MqnE [Candidatus Aquicultor secundus]